MTTGEQLKRGLTTPRRFFEAMKGIDQKFFTILAEGQYTPGHIETIVTEVEAGLPKNALWKNLITVLWEEWKSEEKNKNPKFKVWPNDENPSRYHLAGIKPDNNTLQITLDPCISYAEYVAGNSEIFIKLFPNKSERPYPLAVSTVLIARNAQGEEHVMLTRRAAMHDYKPLGYHVTGGFMEIKKDKTPVDTAKREVAEEAGIKLEDVKDSDLMCRGVIHNNLSGHADMVFEASTDKTVEEIMRTKGDGENTRLFIPLSPLKLREWIVAPTHANVVITSAALTLLGRSRFGDKWYEEVMSMLAYRSKDYGNAATQKTLEERDIARLHVKWTAAKGETDE